jgi:hypothetical protein
MPFEVKRAMAVSEAMLELGLSYGALPIFTTQSSAHEAEILLVHNDSVFEDNVVVPIEEADCKMSELGLIKQGSEFDRFNPGCSTPSKCMNVFFVLKIKRSEDPTAIGGPGFPFLSPVVTKIS